MPSAGRAASGRGKAQPTGMSALRLGPGDGNLASVLWNGRCPYRPRPGRSLALPMSRISRDVRQKLKQPWQGEPPGEPWRFGSPPTAPTAQRSLIIVSTASTPEASPYLPFFSSSFGQLPSAFFRLPLVSSLKSSRMPVLFCISSRPSTICQALMSMGASAFRLTP